MSSETAAMDVDDAASVDGAACAGDLGMSALRSGGGGAKVFKAILAVMAAAASANEPLPNWIPLELRQLSLEELSAIDPWTKFKKPNPRSHAMYNEDFLLDCAFIAFFFPVKGTAWPIVWKKLIIDELVKDETWRPDVSGDEERLKTAEVAFTNRTNGLRNPATKKRINDANNRENAEKKKLDNLERRRLIHQSLQLRYFDTQGTDLPGNLFACIPKYVRSRKDLPPGFTDFGLPSTVTSFYEAKTNYATHGLDVPPCLFHATPHDVTKFRVEGYKDLTLRPSDRHADDRFDYMGKEYKRNWATCSILLAILHCFTEASLKTNPITSNYLNVTFFTPGSDSWDLFHQYRNTNFGGIGGIPTEPPHCFMAFTFEHVPFGPETPGCGCIRFHIPTWSLEKEPLWYCPPVRPPV